MEFLIEEIAAGKFSEIFDYRIFIDNILNKENGHIKILKSINCNGAEYSDISLNFHDKRSIIYYKKNQRDSQNYVTEENEIFLSEVVESIKSNKYV